MKIGLVNAILEDYDFKKMIDTVSGIGYECVEVACWPKAKAERRYDARDFIYSKADFLK